MTDTREIIAYEIYPPAEMQIVPASVYRPWMEATQNRFAYRCLPLAIANQAGWIVPCPASFSARWDGGPQPSGVTLVFDVTPPDNRITPLFGHGTITFHIPYLMRTPEGVNLWVKGPANIIKDGVQALEGMVETDWTAASFTMNWKLTRAGQIVRFERGEPICFMAPYPRNFLESFEAVCKPLHENEALHDQYHHWSKERDAFQARVAVGDPEAVKRGWQKDYFQGHDPGSERFESHQTKLNVCPFHSKMDSSS